MVLYVGTVVTGSGPHAGDADSPRNGLDPLQVSQLHADVVFLLRRAHGRAAAARCAPPAHPRPSRAVAVLLLVVELAQGRSASCSTSPTCPIVLVGFHMLGAALISAAVTWALIQVRETLTAEGASTTARPAPP